MPKKRKHQKKSHSRHAAGFYAGPWWGPSGWYYGGNVMNTLPAGIQPPLSEQFGGYAEGIPGSDGATGSY